VIRPGGRFEIATNAGAVVTQTSDARSRRVAELPAGTIVVVAQATEAGRVRLSSPGGWTETSNLGAEVPAIPRKVGRRAFMERHLDLAPGEFYGLEFPFSLEGIGSFGPEFLTKAFHAAGTISKDNRVVGIRSLEPCEGGAASEKAYLTVDYARAEPGLANELFVKMSVGDPERKYFLASTVRDEVALGRLSAECDFPIEVPKFYFGDYSDRTSNYLLVTDRVGFGEGPIAPVCEKGLDHQLPDAHERYLVLTRSLARLVAAHKTGALGLDFEASFPFLLGTRATKSIPSAAEKLDRIVSFVRDTAPQLFPKAVVDPVVLEAFQTDVLFALEHMDELVDAVRADVDYTGFCHPNLNLDNAWFWRDADDRLHAGLLDWGSTGQMSLGQALVGMLMFPEPDTYPQLLDDVIDAFVEELAKSGGPELRPEVLRRHYKVAQFNWSLPTILEIVVDTLDRFSVDEYASMADAFDPRLEETGLRAGIVWLAVVLLDWAGGETPGEGLRALFAVRRST